MTNDKERWLLLNGPEVIKKLLRKGKVVGECCYCGGPVIRDSYNGGEEVCVKCATVHNYKPITY